MLKDVQKHVTWRTWSAVSGAQVQRQTVKTLGLLTQRAHSLSGATSMLAGMDGSHTLILASQEGPAPATCLAFTKIMGTLSLMNNG